jgi:hypothetical protein
VVVALPLGRREVRGDHARTAAPGRDGHGNTGGGSPGVFYYVTEPGEVYRSADGGASFDLIDGLEGARGNTARSVLVVND